MTAIESSGEKVSRALNLTTEQRSQRAVGGPLERDADWHGAAVWARRLAFLSLILVFAEGCVGLGEGIAADSVALTAWALGSAPEAFACLIVIWRFSGSRILSDNSERRAQRGVALSFWLMAPYIAAESVHHLLRQHDTGSSVVGIVVTAIALLQMPLIGWAQHRLGMRLASDATVGKGIQNYLCGAQAAAVLAGLALTWVWADGWWVDPVVGLCIAAISLWQGFRSWRGKHCGC